MLSRKKAPRFGGGLFLLVVSDSITECDGLFLVHETGEFISPAFVEHENRGLGQVVDLAKDRKRWKVYVDFGADRPSIYFLSDPYNPTKEEEIPSIRTVKARLDLGEVQIKPGAYMRKLEQIKKRREAAKLRRELAR